jgi:hypothetical protein
MAVNFVAGVLTTPTNRMDIGLGSISNFSPIEPTVVVNPADPANLAVSSHNGVLLSTNAGGNFSNVFNFTNPPGTDTFNGDTDLIFDSQGRLFWSNLAGIGTMGVSVNEIDPVTGANISTTNVRSNGDDKEFTWSGPGTSTSRRRKFTSPVRRTKGSPGLRRHNSPTTRAGKVSHGRQM